jgi:glycosyltransferase involved in cell wall biosynthesis
MRAAVYNRFLHSMGGGERHSGKLAEVLAAEGWDVDLIGHTDVDRDELARHLDLDLSAVRLRIEPDAGEEAVTDISADYDLFVNASYMSRARPKAKRNVYLCYFPTPSDHDLARWQRWLARRVGRRVSGASRLYEYGTGWYPPEGGRRRTWTWTTGDAVLVVGRSTPRQLVMDLGRPGATGATTLRLVDQDDVEHAVVEVRPEFARHTVTVGQPGKPLELRFLSGSFTPGQDDPRSLGVAVSRLRVGGERASLGEQIGSRFPWLLRNPLDRSWLAGYDLVVANSDYTRGWIRRYWGVDSAVLFPPIKLSGLEPGGTREPLIAAVGRFFAPGHGHSKKQLELVRFFGDLVRSGRLPGWRLHLVGGCEPRQASYLEQVRAAAAGLPVDVSANAPRDVVERLLDTATVFWHATGYGEDEERAPWAFEHFGMTTVEAMAGGCVPVVIDKAGQREIVREGVDGFRWSTPAELVDRTVQVATDDALRARLSASSVQRAQEFSESAFVDRWRVIAAEHGLEPGRA